MKGSIMSAYLENSKDDLELKTQILQLFSNFTTLAPQISKICNIVHFSGFLSKYVPGSKALKN